MTPNRLIALPLWLLTGAVLLTGCMPPPPPPAPAPTTQAVISTPDKIAAYRQTIEKLKPGSIVGEVAATEESNNTAAIKDVPMKDFKVGQTLAFVDADGNPINNGQVVNVTENYLVVRYDPQGKRAPQKGDMALWLKE